MLAHEKPVGQGNKLVTRNQIKKGMMTYVSIHITDQKSR